MATVIQAQFLIALHGLGVYSTKLYRQMATTFLIKVSESLQDPDPEVNHSGVAGSSRRV